MTGIDHDALRDAAGLFVLGALVGEERAAFEAHLATCAECQADVRALERVVTTLPYAVAQVDPPPALRARVLAVAGGERSRDTSTRARSSFAMGGWLSAAALLVVSVALGAYAYSLRERVGGLERQLRAAVDRLDRSEQELVAAKGSADRAQLRLAVLTAPDLKQVQLAGQPPAPRAAGRAFWSRSNGLLFAANQLPPLPAGRTYQLWFLTPGAPVSAGLLTPDPNGRVTAAFDAPADAVTPTGLAVSIEPEGGVLAPTGAIYLAGQSQ